MDNETQEKKTCENCRYFLQHYVKRKAYYGKTYCGHCTNEKADRLFRKFYRNDTACEFWETIAIQKEERKEFIEKVLRDTARQIRHIALILKDDADE